MSNIIRQQSFFSVKQLVKVLKERGLFGWPTPSIVATITFKWMSITQPRRFN